MAIIQTKQVNKEHIKVRWRELYVSHALNRKQFGNQPTGIYAGFNIEITGYRNFRISGDQNPVNFQGSSSGYNQGAYDATSGFSVAVFEDTNGHNNSIVIPPGAVSGDFDFDLTDQNNKKVIFALDTDYFISNETEAQVLAIDDAELSDNPHYLVIGVVNLPSDGVSANSNDIDYEDNQFPRTLPLATPKKYGYMSPQQATFLQSIGSDADHVYSSPNDANVYWRLDSVSGGVLEFTGDILYNLPTDDFNVLVSVSGTSVFPIDNKDVVYFEYPVDGSVTGVGLEIAPVNSIPEPTPGVQQVMLGMRDNNDFWFKTGQKWEVGEFKPFGVTSKFPNLTVGETGNPPQEDSVSGIFFDNAQVSVQPGGKDVRVFVNVSGAIPDAPIEEEILVSAASGQQSFTMTDSDLFWVFDDDRLDISVFQNGQKLIQWRSSTSGIEDSFGNPVWGYKKSGTRSIQTQDLVPQNGVLTVRLEANKGINAYEEEFIVTATSGQTNFQTDREFSIDNSIKDIKIYRNGQKIQYNDLPQNLNIHGARKTSTTEVEFNSTLPKDAVVNIRWEGTQIVPNVSAISGDEWSDPVDSHLGPLTDATYDLGQSKRFRNANFSGDGSFGGDFYIGGKLNVSGGIDPIYLQLNPTSSSNVPDNAIFIDSGDGEKLKFKDNTGIPGEVGSGSGSGSSASGISLEEADLMQNPYPFDIEAPRWVSVSGDGVFFVLTNPTDAESVDNSFGLLVSNVSAFGSDDIGSVQWRGKTDLIGFDNGPVFVSGTGVDAGQLVSKKDYVSVSGHAVLRVGIVKSEELFIRPQEGLLL